MMLKDSIFYNVRIGIPWTRFGKSFKVHDLLLLVLMLTFIPTFLNYDISCMQSVRAQNPSSATSTNNSNINAQQWIDKANNMKIQFSHSPQTPVVDSKTQLRFVVQNVTNSRNINDLHARVVVTTNSSGQMRIFKFENISSSNGDFSVNYFFPDSGIYQVMTRVDSNDLSSLGSFKVDVPFQPFGTVTAPTYSFSLIIIAAIIIAVAALSFLLIVQHKQKIPR